MQLDALPSTFYRVTAKALIFDDQRRLLVVGPDESWEMPGGGWEHEESFEECLRREITEELGVEVSHIGVPQFIYRGQSSRGWFTIRIAVDVSVKSHDFVCGDGMTRAKFVTHDEFLKLRFGSSEEGVLNHADQIWGDNDTE